MVEYKLVESKKYIMGENHSKWYLHTGLYQNRDFYYYTICDKDNMENVIISSVVSCKIINNLENAIIKATENSNRIETIEDFYNEIQKGFYSTMFKMQVPI